MPSVLMPVSACMIRTPGVQKRHLVIGVISFDVVFGVIDEPILQDTIAVETDATFGVGVKIG